MKNYFKYTLHNLIAHPVMEILHLLGFTELGNKIHDMTLPNDHEDNQEKIDQDEFSIPPVLTVNMEIGDLHITKNFEKWTVTFVVVDEDKDEEILNKKEYEIDNNEIYGNEKSLVNLLNDSFNEYLKLDNRDGIEIKFLKK